MAKISYKISGSYDPQGMNDAKRSLESLKNAVASINNVMRGFAAVHVFGKLREVVSGSTDAFAKQNQAINQLNQSLAKNASITAGAFSRLQSFSAQLQRKSVFGDEVLQSQMAFLSSLRLTEDQIKSTVTAAADLAGAGIGTLERNVRTLAATLNGVPGNLANLIPGFKTLTAEQLKAGEAIKMVNENYAGFAESVANTFSGKNTQFDNLVKDIQEKIGQIFGNTRLALFEKLTPHLENFNAWLDENINTITAFVLAFPETARAAFTLIKSIFNKIFSNEFWIEHGNKFIEVFEQAGKNIADFFVTVTEEFALMFPHVMILMWKNTLASWKNIFTEWLPGFFSYMKDKIEKWAGDNYGPGSPERDETGRPIGENEPEDNTEDHLKPIAESLRKIDGGVKKLTDETIKTAAAAGDVLVDAFGEDLDIFKENVLDAMANQRVWSAGTPEPAIPEPAIPEPVVDDGAGGSNDGVVSKKTTYKDVEQAAYDSFGEFGSAFSNLMNGNPLGILSEIVTKFASMLMSIENFGKTMNFISTIFDTVREVIEPLVNQAFAPFVLMLERIGQIIGYILIPIINRISNILTPIMVVINTIFDIVTPLIDVFFQLVNILNAFDPILALFTAALEYISYGIGQLYNEILLPVVNAILWIFTGVANAFVSIWNMVRDVVKTITFGAVDIGAANEIKYDDIKLEKVTIGSSADYQQGGRYNNQGDPDSSGSYGSSGSYQAAKDVYVNIYFNSSYVNGDAQEIAVMLRNEIRAAEALGY